MKFLKKNMKVIVAFVLGSILTGGIVFASGEYLASQVDYKNNKTVEEALDDLYGKIPSGTISEINSGNGTLNSDGTITISDLSFTPSEVWIYAVLGPTQKLIVHSTSENTEYWATAFETNYYGSNQPAIITSNGFSYTATGWGNSSIRWTAVK